MTHQELATSFKAFGYKDYFRFADQLAQNLIFTLPRTPFAQVS
jgi:hypothetical protein